MGLGLTRVRSSFNLLTDIQHFKKDFLNLLRLRSHQYDVIQFQNVPRIPPLGPRPRPTPTPPPPPPPPPSPSTFPPLPVITVDHGLDEKPVIFPDYGDYNEVLFREQTLTKNFHNKK